jgi:hypothetical protein
MIYLSAVKIHKYCLLRMAKLGKGINIINNKKGLALIFCSVFSFSRLISLEYGNFTVTPSITLRNEYDSNVNLADGKNREIKKDFVFYINPGIVFNHHYLQHVTTFYCEGNYRKGWNTDLSNLNSHLGGDVDLKFPGGLQFNVYDKYLNSSFDQALWDEVGILSRQSNKIGAAVSYNMTNRLTMDTRYNHVWDEFEYQSKLTARNIDDISAKISFPVLNSTSGYVTGSYLIQDSRERLDKNHNNSKVLTGIKWSGRYRFSFWLDGGYQDISYNLPLLKDYRNAIGNIGIQIKISETMNSEIYAGRDGYGNIVYGFSYGFDYLEQMLIYLSVKKETITSFSSAHLSGIFEYTRARLQFVKRLYQKLTFNTDYNYQLQDADDRNNKRKSHTWIGNVNLYYPIQDWIKIGIHYQYSLRESFKNEYEFEDNRIGFYITLLK